MATINEDGDYSNVVKQDIRRVYGSKNTEPPNDTPQTNGAERPVNLPGRYHIREETERAIWRREFFDLYQAERRFQNIITFDLRPASQGLVEPRDRKRFFLLPSSLVRGEHRIVDEPYQRYVDLLRERASQLRLTVNGEPAEWAVQVLHGLAVDTIVKNLAM